LYARMIVLAMFEDTRRLRTYQRKR